MSKRSLVEERICSRDFSYLKPYFYNHPYALRCELGIGDTDNEYMDNARERAEAIYNILFPHGADAIIFDCWLYDYCDSGEAEYLQYNEDEDIECIIEDRILGEVEQLKFLLTCQFKYRHFTVQDLAVYDAPDDPDYGSCRRNRVVCYSDGVGFDYHNLILRQIHGTRACDVSFVSFDNECIFSIYDDRGCDIVFMTHDRLMEFYHELQPYFLEYDIEEMEKRLWSTNGL